MRKMNLQLFAKDPDPPAPPATPTDPPAPPPAPAKKEEPNAWEKALKPILDRLTALESSTPPAATVTIPVPPKPKAPEPSPQQQVQDIAKPKSLLSLFW